MKALLLKKSYLMSISALAVFGLLSVSAMARPYQGPAAASAGELNPAAQGYALRSNGGQYLQRAAFSAGTHGLRSSSHRLGGLKTTTAMSKDYALRATHLNYAKAATAASKTIAGPDKGYALRSQGGQYLVKSSGTGTYNKNLRGSSLR